jgi:hypothetical protein
MDLDIGMAEFRERRRAWFLNPSLSSFTETIVILAFLNFCI